jgi:rhodanese-related sulfurtransferase
MNLPSRPKYVLFYLLFAFLLSSLGTSCSAPQEGYPKISQDDLLARIRSDSPPLIVDVRSSREFSKGHVPGAVNIPYRRISDHLDELRASEGRGIVVYCAVGGRTMVAKKVLLEAGFKNVFHLDGDMSGWQKRGLPIEVPVRR